jgi:predicted PurR-regulated permease PerM
MTKETSSPPSAPATVVSLRDRAGGIIAFGIILTLLYFGRDVLIPLTLALMLSLLIAPLVRVLRRVGLGQTVSVLTAVLALAVLFAATALVLGTQVIRMASSLPQYQETIQQKLQSLDDLTVGRLNVLTTEVGRLIENRGAAGTPTRRERATEQTGLAASASPIPVELQEPRAHPFQIIGRVLASLWVPIETAGIVLIVLVFVLLEHDSLRDRFIRIAGGANIRLTTLALNDAGERLSRFFVSQFAVNAGVGATIGIGLALLGLPHATLWATLAAIMRFVPYVGLWIAALFSTVLAVAVVPGWSLALETLALFVLVDVIAGQVVEPQLYGHTTGLSPLSVVVAAIFWGTLWGPVGLILSTPLTLCLVVGGRHIKALRLLDLLLGDAQVLTLPQKFYQRALSGDSHEIIVVARAFLKRNSLAAYCDRVMMPAMHLALLDYEMGAISDTQQMMIRDVIVTVVSAIGGEGHKHSRRHQRVSVLDRTGSGRLLRQQREHVSGVWQGPVSVPPGSVMVCIGMGSLPDDLAAELLVRILRSHKLDARHFSAGELGTGLPPGADPGAVAIVYLVSAFPSTERESHTTVTERIRQLLPDAPVVNVFLPGVAMVQTEFGAQAGNSEQEVTSFAQAVQICLEQRQEPSKAGMLEQISR